MQELLIAKAKALKIELPETELDNAYIDAKKNIPPTSFDEELKKRNLTAADMREDLRRNLLAQKVVDKEVDREDAVDRCRHQGVLRRQQGAVQSH